MHYHHKRACYGDEVGDVLVHPSFPLDSMTEVQAVFGHPRSEAPSNKNTRPVLCISSHNAFDLSDYIREIPTSLLMLVGPRVRAMVGLGLDLVPLVAGA